MALTLPTETVIERQINQMDNQHIRDLAIIGLDKVKAGRLPAGNQMDEKTIEDLKRNLAIIREDCPEVLDPNSPDG